MPTCVRCDNEVERGESLCPRCSRRVGASYLGQSPEADVAEAPSLPTWEYLVVSSGTIRKGTLVDRLNALGREGWEVVGFAQSDKTIGINSLEVLMKRQLPEMISPEEAPRPARGVAVGSGRKPDTENEGERFNCLECGLSIPAGSMQCYNCGWSWSG